MGLILLVRCSASWLLTRLVVAPWKVVAIRATQQSSVGVVPSSSESGAEVATGPFGQALLTTMTVSTMGQVAQSEPSVVVDVSMAKLV